jgi:hypothetical protein
LYARGADVEFIVANPMPFLNGSLSRTEEAEDLDFEARRCEKLNFLDRKIENSYFGPGPFFC